MKWPPFSSTSPVDFWTSPIVSHIPLATALVMKHTGMSWTWTQNRVVLNTKSHTGVFELYLCSMTRCLLKLQGWCYSIQSTSPRLSKTNRTQWSFWLCILKPFVDLHSCLKVLAMVWILRKRRVKNCAARMNSPVCWSCWRKKPVFSLSDREKVPHLAAKSSIICDCEVWDTNRVSLTPNETKPHKLRWVGSHLGLCIKYYKWVILHQN